MTGVRVVTQTTGTCVARFQKQFVVKEVRLVVQKDGNVTAKCAPDEENANVLIHNIYQRKDVQITLFVLMDSQNAPRETPAVKRRLVNMAAVLYPKQCAVQMVSIAVLMDILVTLVLERATKVLT